MAKKMALGKGIASLLHDAAPATVVNQTYNAHFNNSEAPAVPVEKEIEVRVENTHLLVDKSKSTKKNF